jgi:hypothetical protein
VPDASQRSARPFDFAQGRLPRRPSPHLLIRASIRAGWAKASMALALRVPVTNVRCPGGGALL